MFAIHRVIDHPPFEMLFEKRNRRKRGPQRINSCREWTNNYHRLVSLTLDVKSDGEGAKRGADAPNLIRPPSLDVHSLVT